MKQAILALRKKIKQPFGFTLVELVIAIAIIGLIATVVFVALGSVTKNARDTKRKADLAQIGRFFSLGSCFLPTEGAGTYDLVSLVDELKVSYPQYASFLSQIPKDPKSGNASESFYRYVVTEDVTKCVLYANLENADEPVTLTKLTAPTAGGGNGVLAAQSDGWNGTNRYFQVSN